MVQQIIEDVRNELNIDDSEDHQATDFVTQMANAAMSNQQVIPQLLTQVQQLSQLVLQMQTQLQAEDNPTPRTRNNRYCWTHGRCGHTGK